MIKMLVVDDEPKICERIKETFDYVGFTVFTATTAEKASAIFKREKPNVIFLDIVMPDKNGLELLKEFKRLDPKVIVMMVTVLDDAETRARAMELGADDYITKGFTDEDLRLTAVRKIQEHLDRGGHMSKAAILIVDDEKMARDSIRKFILPRYACNIEEASDGQTAVNKVKEMQPDVIFLDIRMPGLPALDAVSQIKQISPHSKIIVISGWTNQEVVAEAFNRGVFDYISKPIVLDLLEEKLEAVLTSMGKLKKIKGKL